MYRKENSFPDTMFADVLMPLTKKIRLGESFFIEGIPGVGSSTIVRTLCFNDKVSQRYFNDRSIDFVYVDCFALEEDTPEAFFSLLVECIDPTSPIILEESIFTQTRHILISSLQSVDILGIFIDRFNVTEHFEESFFRKLRSLRDLTKNKLLLIPMVPRVSTFEQTQPMEGLGSYLKGNSFIMPLSSEESLIESTRIYADQKEVIVDEGDLAFIARTAGGHRGLAKILLELCIAYGDTSCFTNDFLLKDTRIAHSLSQIERYFTRSELGQIISGNYQALSTILQDSNIVDQAGALRLPLLKQFIDNRQSYETESISVIGGQVLIGNKTRVHLTPQELEIFTYISDNPEIVITRDQLADALAPVTDGVGVTNELIDQYISRIRKKVEADPKEPKYIETIYGRGYIFHPNPT